MKIALFEDDNTHAEKITDMIKEWAEQSGRSAAVVRFTGAVDPDKLLPFDCVLLDVEMPGKNGVELAREIRGTGSMIPIVFISSHTEYSLDGYEVDPLRFINKNDRNLELKFIECMDKAAYESENSFKAVYKIKLSRKTISIPMIEILYFEIFNHDLIIHTITGTFQERKTLAELKRDLPKQFVQCARSYVINIFHAVEVAKKYVVLRNKQSIPVSSNYSDSVYEAFLNMR